MQCLPPIVPDDQAGEYELVLPCPTLECIRLLAWYHGDRSKPILAQQLLENPSLLIFSAVSYRNKLHTVPHSAELLVDWFAEQVKELLGSIASQASSSSVAHPTESSLRRYCYRDSSSFFKPLRKYLISLQSPKDQDRRSLRFIRQFLMDAVELPIPTAKKLVKGWLPSLLASYRAGQVGDRNLSAPSTCEATFEPTCESTLIRWLIPGIFARDCEGLLQLHRNFSDLSERFEAQLQQEKLASLQQLAYGASHEINNPLANIASRAQTLLATESHPDRRGRLGTIYEQAIRSHEMISDLMLFANPPKLSLAVVDVRTFLSRLIHQVESRQEARPVKVKFNSRIPRVDGQRMTPPGSHPPGSHPPGSHPPGSHPPGSHPPSLHPPVTCCKPPIQLIVRVAPGVQTLKCDSTQLNVALLALIQNSIESILRAGGNMIELRVSMQAGQAHFAVTDDGQGIPRHLERHLFDPFFSGQEAGRGLGFGLSKAWRIAQLHGGSLTCDRELDTGARFVLRIPC